MIGRVGMDWQAGQADGGEVGGFAQEHHDPTPPGQPHGFDHASHDKHVRMAQAIADCEALLCSGMGMGAYWSIRKGWIAMMDIVLSLAAIHCLRAAVSRKVAKVDKSR